MSEKTILVGYAVGYMISWELPNNSTEVVVGVHISDAQNEAAAVQETKEAQRDIMAAHQNERLRFMTTVTPLKLDVKKAVALLKSEGALPRQGPRKRELREALGSVVATWREITQRTGIIQQGGGSWYLLSVYDYSKMQNASIAATNVWTDSKVGPK